MSKTHLQKISSAGLLIAIGIVFGDIGTSPLYTFKAIIRESPIDELLVLGSLSCIIWTLTLQTTVKYVIITLRADNNGEGGILALYALIRRYGKKGLLLPAIAGASFLLADGIITPPISVSSAIEGLQKFHPDLNTVPYVIVILTILFVSQQFGTQWLGKIFGPVMLVWFLFIGIIGLLAIIEAPSVLKALSPHYALQLLIKYPGGFWLLGGVFLCTTGAEALYSDMGHVGRENIRVSWFFIKICLILSYAGQGVWLLKHQGIQIGLLNPFYEIVPPWLFIFSIILSTLATIIASQALITGSFTLIGEAMRLDIWLRMRINYPTDFKGQLYVPQINWFLMAGCIGMVLYFRESSKMEAAFGLSVTLTMLMSTILMFTYMKVNRYPIWIFVPLTLLFLSVELSFLTANLLKFRKGGWITMLIGLFLIAIMWIWYNAKVIKNRLTTFKDIKPYLDKLKFLSDDTSIPRISTNLVYLCSSKDPFMIEDSVLYSIINRQPKRADNYWFININVSDEPFKTTYKLTTLAKNDVYHIRFNLGFRIEPRINYFFRLVVEEMVKNGEVNIISQYDSLNKDNVVGDFRFVVLESFLSYENDLPPIEKFTMSNYYLLNKIGLNSQASYGLDTSNVTIEKYPLIINRGNKIVLEREE